MTSLGDFFFSPMFKTMVILPKCVGSLSIVGSASIIYDILWRGDRAHKLGKSSSQILLALSASDIIYTFVAHFWGTWLVPAGTVYLASGNDATCTMQAFVASTAGETSIVLNAALGISYVLVVRQGWREERLRKIVPRFFLLGFPVLFNLAFAIWPFVDQAYNFSLWACYIQEYPLGCDQSDEVECERGANSASINFAQQIITLTCIFIVSASVVLLWHSMWSRERSNAQMSFTGENTSTQSKRMATQGMYYAGCFFLTWSPWIALTFMGFAGTPVPSWFGVFAAALLPLQGLFNAFVYFRPRRAAAMRRSGRLSNKSKRSSGATTSSSASRFSGYAASMLGGRSIRGNLAAEAPAVEGSKGMTQRSETVNHGCDLEASIISNDANHPFKGTLVDEAGNVEEIDHTRRTTN